MEGWDGNIVRNGDFRNNIEWYLRIDYGLGCKGDVVATFGLNNMQI